MTVSGVGEVGGKRIADANVSDKVKTQKAIVRDFLDGTNNRVLSV